MIEEKMHDDLISRQEAIEALIRLSGCESKNEIIDICADSVTDGERWLGGILDGISELEDLPPAQPKIIRCKECEHWKDSDGVYRRGIGAESKCPLNLRQVYDGTFFCGYAERRL